MHAIQTRLTYLRNREGLGVFALPAALVYNWLGAKGPVLWDLRIAALVLVSYILLQGTLYWHMKLRTVDGRQPLPAYFHTLFIGFRWSNVIAIGAMLAALYFAATGSASRADLGWCAGLLALAVLEQVNYYHYQLMYDTRGAWASLRRNGRLRDAALGLDIARSRAAHGGGA